MPPAARTAHVRVPATSANLGPGFDALGLALALHDDVTASVADRSEIAVTGHGAGAVPLDDGHLVLRAFRAGCAALGVAAPEVRLDCQNRIPHGRGLGSSAAAIVAGVLLARGLAGADDDVDAALQVATELEGHPDNVAACLAGGLTIAWQDGDGARMVRRDCTPVLRPVALVPPFALATEAARAALPTTVPHADAARTAGRAALLVAAATDRPEFLFAATEDRLHQPYRAPLLGLAAELVTRLRADGLPAVVSGAGPTVLVLTASADQARRAAAATPPGWQARALSVDADGARLSTGAS